MFMLNPGHPLVLPKDREVEVKTEAAGILDATPTVSLRTYNQAANYCSNNRLMVLENL